MNPKVEFSFLENQKFKRTFKHTRVFSVLNFKCLFPVLDLMGMSTSGYHQSGL